MPQHASKLLLSSFFALILLEVISYSKNLSRSELPLPKTRDVKVEGDIVGHAAQAFNVQNKDNSSQYVGYIMGHLALPPGGVKDYESVGPCAQTFTVCHCQPGSLEVSYADPEDEERMYNAETAQRFLLSPGDMFRIPQNNTYQLQNHSTTTECLLTWTIIRPHDSNP
jgi:centromere protein C